MAIHPRTVDNNYLFMVAISSLLLASKVKANGDGTFTVDSAFQTNVTQICQYQSDPEICLILSSARNKEGVYVLGGRVTSLYIDEGNTREANLTRVLYSSIFNPGLTRVSAMLTAATLIGQIPLEGDIKFFSLSNELRKQALHELDMLIEQIADTPVTEPEEEKERASVYLALELNPLSAQNTASNADLRPENFTLGKAGQPVIGVKTYSGITLQPGESLTTEVFITSRGPDYGEYFDQTLTLAQNTQPVYTLTNPALPYNATNNPYIVNTQVLTVSPSDIALALSSQINNLSLNASTAGIANIMSAASSGGQQSYPWQRSIEGFWTDSNIATAVSYYKTVPNTVTTVDQYLTAADTSITATATANGVTPDLPGYGIVRSGNVMTDIMELKLAPRRVGGHSVSEMISIYPMQISRAATSAVGTLPALPAYSNTVSDLIMGSGSDYTNLLANRPVSVILGVDNKNLEEHKEFPYDTFYFNSTSSSGSGTITYRITSQAEPGVTYTTPTFTWDSAVNTRVETVAAQALWSHMSTRLTNVDPDLPYEDVVGLYAAPHAIQIIAWRGSTVIAPNFQLKVVVDIVSVPAGIQVATGDVNRIKPNSLWGSHASVSVEYQAKRMSLEGNKKDDDVNELIKAPDVTAKTIKPRKMRSNKFQAALDRIERTEMQKNQYDLY